MNQQSDSTTELVFAWHIPVDDPSTAAWWKMFVKLISGTVRTPEELAWIDALEKLTETTGIIEHFNPLHVDLGYADMESVELVEVEISPQDNKDGETALNRAVDLVRVYATCVGSNALYTGEFLIREHCWPGIPEARSRLTGPGVPEARAILTVGIMWAAASEGGILSSDEMFAALGRAWPHGVGPRTLFNMSILDADEDPPAEPVEGTHTEDPLADVETKPEAEG